LESRVEKKDRQAIETSWKDLEARKSDFWPNQDQDKVERILKELRYTLLILMADENVLKGNLKEAMLDLDQALELKPDSLAMQQKRRTIEQIQLHIQMASQKLLDGEMENAVDAIKKCYTLGEREVLSRWKELDDLREEILRQLDHQANSAISQGWYVDALKNYELAKRINAQDVRLENLFRELRDKLRDVRKSYEEVAATRKNINVVAVEKLLDKMEPIQTRWGLTESE